MQPFIVLFISDICKAPKKTAFLFPHCHEDYSSENEEEGVFSAGWNPPRNVTYKVGQTPEYIPEDELLPWQYQDALTLNGVPYPGKLNLYGGGGFVSEFGVSKDKAYEIARYLNDNDWYDELTRAIFLEFTVYNANTNLFSVAQILIELPSTGGGVMSQYVHTFRLYHYYGGMAIVSVVLQVSPQRRSILSISFCINFYFDLLNVLSFRSSLFNAINIQYCPLHMCPYSKYGCFREKCIREKRIHEKRNDGIWKTVWSILVFSKSLVNCTYYAK